MKHGLWKGGAALAAILCAAAAPARAAYFQTGFETSSGYTADGTLIGVHDSSAPAGVTWTSLFNGGQTASSANPASGALSFQMTDSSTSTAYGAYLNLNSAGISTATPFTLSFSVALSNLGGTGNAAQIYLGAASTSLGSQKYWTGLLIDSTGLITIGTDSASGTSVNNTTLGNYTTFASLGQYLTVSITIDPTTMKYTDVSLSGALSSADKTATVQAASGGVVPWLHSDTSTLPAFNLLFVGGTATTATMQVDNVSIAAVPDPAPAGLLGLGLVALAGGAARRRLARSR